MSLDFSDNQVSESLRPYLQKVGMSSSVPEAHGLFTGILCGSSSEQKKKKWLWLSLLDLNVDDSDMLAQEAIGVVDEFFGATLNGLSASELDFKLAIEEHASLDERLEDFSIWVQGFLYGLGLSHNEDFSKNSEQVQEFMQDLLQISNAEEYELSDDDEDERALFELIEYVRVGVLLVFEELNPITQTTPIDVTGVEDSIH